MARKNLEDQLHDVEDSYRKLVEEIEEQLNELEERASKALDEMQDQLPEDAAEIMARIREMTLATRRRLWMVSEQALDATREAVDSLAEATTRLARRPGLRRAPAKGKARKGTAKKAAKKPAKKAATKSSKASAQWSKADLYAEATRLDIAGRSSMSKAELVRAINRAS